MGQEELTPIARVPEPAAMFSLLAATPHTVGELLDFADNIPAAWVSSVVLMIGRSLYDDYCHGKHPDTRRRRLVIFGALVNRLIFEVEGVPRKRGHLL